MITFPFWKRQVGRTADFETTMHFIFFAVDLKTKAHAWVSHSIEKCLEFLDWLSENDSIICISKYLSILLILTLFWLDFKGSTKPWTSHLSEFSHFGIYVTCWSHGNDGDGFTSYLLSCVPCFQMCLRQCRKFENRDMTHICVSEMFKDKCAWGSELERVKSQPYCSLPDHYHILITCQYNGVEMDISM